MTKSEKSLFKVNLLQKNKQFSGVFISVEGGEGVGKSVFCQSLVDALQKTGRQTLRTFEPGGTPSANAIRSLFLSPPAGDSLFAETELFLVSAARTQHIQRQLLPALQNGQWVVCDRYFDSTRVYQGILPGLPQGFVEDVIKLSVQGVEPQVTFLLDCDVEVALQRVKQRSLTDAGSSRFDAAHVDFHRRLRDGYLSLVPRFKERFVVLDASRSPAEVLREALMVLQKRTGQDFG